MIRVILADDHRMFRETLKVPLEAEPDIEIVGEARTGAETLSLLEQHKADVLVIDINLPDVSGIDVARKVRLLYPELHAVALSGYADRVYIEAMLKAGALGYVVKSAGTSELVAAIRAAAKGATYLSQDAASAMTRRVLDDNELGPPPKFSLTPREQEVLCLLAEGKRAAEIASALGISVATADVHRRNIKTKLGDLPPSDWSIS
jgi:DNA-binding NarL/FixJ family response regulator